MSKISIVVMHHDHKQQEYLDLCLRSLDLQEVNKEVIAVDSTPNGAVYRDYDWLKVKRVPNDVNSAICGNIGFKMADANSKYFLFANDDTVFTIGSIAEMMQALGDNKSIMNAQSNCDNQWLFYKNITIKKDDKILGIPRFFDISAVRGLENEMIYYPPGERIVIPVPFVCFYATIMHQSTWWEVGGLDENYDSGPDDRDFCMRAAQKGIQSFINLGTTIWHFGGTTVNKVESEKSKIRRAKNAEYFQKKWGFPQ